MPRKRRTTTANIRTTKKERQKVYDKTYNNKNSNTAIKVTNSPRKLKLKLDFKRRPTQINHNKQQPNDTSNSTHAISNSTYANTQLIESANDIIPKQLDLSADPRELVKLLLQQNKALQSQIQSKNKQLDIAQNQIQKYKHQNMSLKKDISKLIQNSTEVEVNTKNDTAFNPTLTMNISHDISIITEKTLTPEFTRAVNEYIKIRLKLQALKNSRSLNNLINILNVHNKIKNPDLKPLQLGGKSYGTIDRLMQHKAFDLMRMEVCIVIQRKWTPQSVYTAFFDECSQSKESQLSLLLAFNVKVPENYEYDLEEIFTPKLQAGNVIRAIWHRNIPGKDSKTIMEWAIKPAIDELNEIGKCLYPDDWICLRSVMKKSLAVMTDQNNGALDVGNKMKAEFKVENFIQLLCVMHNVHNMLLKVNDRLLLERDLTLKRQPLIDQQLHNLRNIDIIKIGNRIQRSINPKFEGHQNKGLEFKIFTSYSEDQNFFTNFRRVVGERKQWELHNVQAALSRRVNISDFSQKSKNGKHIASNARDLFEYSNSILLLRESIIMVNIQVMYSDPIMIICGKTVQQMNKFLPILKQSLSKVYKIINQPRFALRTLFQLTQLVPHEQIKPYLLINKLLSMDEKQNILKCTHEDVISEFISDEKFNNPVGLAQAIKAIKQQNNMQFGDKYFMYIFEFEAMELYTVLRQLQGAYFNVYSDLKARYDRQAQDNIPDSALTSDDIGETLNATGKYRGKFAVNINDKTKAAHAVCEVNRPFYTWDWLLDNNPLEFERDLILWHRQCGTYKELYVEKKECETKYHAEKWKKLRIDIELKNEEQVPAPKTNPAKGQKVKSVIQTDFADIECQIWMDWKSHRDKYLRQHLGILISRQRDDFREYLNGYVTRHTHYGQSTVQRWGLPTKQRKLYEYCCSIV